MKSLTPIAAVMTVHQPTPGHYLIRIDDLKYRPLVVAVSKSLEDADSFTVVTPADTKVFKVSQNGAAPKMPINADSDTPMEGSDAPLDDETLAAIKAQESHALPNAEQPETVAEEPAGPKVVRRKRSAPVAGRTEACRRCNGSGEIRSFAGDQPITTKCPVCQGEGTSIRYGERR